MTRISQYLAKALFAGLGVGVGSVDRIARAATSKQSPTRAADWAAIGKLHTLDIEATLTQDPASLTKLGSGGAISDSPARR